MIPQFKWYYLHQMQVVFLRYDEKLKPEVHLAHSEEFIWGQEQDKHQLELKPAPTKGTRHSCPCSKSLLASSLAPGTSIWMTATPNFTLSFLSRSVEMNEVFPLLDRLFEVPLYFTDLKEAFDARNTEHLSLGYHQPSQTGLKSLQEPQLQGRTWMKGGWKLDILNNRCQTMLYS